MTSVDRFEVEFEVEGAILRGELTTGRDPVAGAIFSPAAGLADRDGNDIDVGFAPLGQLARGLAEQGVAVLTSEGRGVGRSSGELAGPQGVLDDFLALFELAAGRYPELGEKPRLLGHGTGCTLAAVAASRLGAGQTGGLVLVAPPVSNVSDLISYRQEARETLQDVPEGEQPALLQEIQVRYSERRAALHPGFRKIACPILAVQGSFDWVFPPSESARLVAEIPGVRRLLLEGLDHWLVRTSRFRGPETNLAPDLEVDPGAIEAIARWICHPA